MFSRVRLEFYIYLYEMFQLLRDFVPCTLYRDSAPGSHPAGDSVIQTT